MKKSISTDSPETRTATVDEISGFLTAPVTLSRVGVQYYLGAELGLEGRSADKVGVFRSPEEVFSQASLDSLRNMVGTDNHPVVPVTVDNVKSLQIGTVSGITPNKERGTVEGLLTITDKNSISKVKNGKVEVSVGYSHDLIPSTGSYQGADYEFEQRSIRGNHLAIVDAGRCGAACRISIDHDKGAKTMIVTLDGLEFQVDDSQLAQAIRKQQKSFDAEKKAMAKKQEEAEDELEEMKKKKDAAEAKADTVSKDVLTTDALNTLVSDRASLIVASSAILGDKMVDCMDCPLEMKTAVVDHVFPDLDLTGKAEAYVDAAFDMAVDRHKATINSVDNLSNDFRKKEVTKTIDDARAEARKGYLKDHLKAEV